jgi:5-methylthioadenosine/S-adenosylhomocysteine deaminase
MRLRLRQALAEKADGTPLKSLLLQNGLIVSQDAHRSVGHRDLLIVDGKIADAAAAFPEDVEKIDVKDRVVLPALINAHLHTGETVFRGFVSGKNLSEYMEVSHNSYLKKTWAENQDLIHDLSASIALCESIRSGIGTVAVSRSWKQVDALGINGFCGYPLINIRKLERFSSRFTTEGNLAPYDLPVWIKTPIFLQGLMTVTDQMLESVRERLAAHPDEMLFIHVAETRNEIEWVRSRYNMTPIEVLHTYGLLGPKTVCIHCVYLNDRDIDLMRSTGAKIVLCPTANMKLKSGLPDFRLLVDSCGDLALGTDGMATNDSASLLEAAKIAGLSALVCELSPQFLIDMVTVNAARVLGVEGQTGSIEVGKNADIAVFRYWPSALSPHGGLLSHLVYNPSAFTCESLIVNGEFVMKNEKIMRVDEERVVREFNELCERLRAE